MGGFNEHEHQESVALLAEDDSDEGKVMNQTTLVPESRISLSFFLSRTIPLLLLIDLFTIIYFLIPPATRAFDTLPLRSSYVGLTELYAAKQIKASKHQSIVNKPLFAAQISSAEPNKIFPQDEHEWLSPEGTLAPPDRHLVLSEHVRTVYQFRAMDFGMESCQLALRLPAEAHWSDVEVRACVTGSSEQMNPRTISWRTKPVCEVYLGSFQRDGALEESKLDKFECEWGKLYSFELGCHSCDVDVWSNQNETWGGFMYQHQTI